MEEPRQLVERGEYGRFRELAAEQSGAVWDVIQHCAPAQIFEALSPSFAELATASTPASRKLALAALNGLNHPDPQALKSPDRRLAREREYPPARPPDPRWFEAALALVGDAELGSRATDLARCVLASAPDDTRRSLLDRCVELDELVSMPRLFNELARSRDPRLLERLRAIAGGDHAPRSRIQAASALIYEAGIEGDERDRLVGTILATLLATDDASSIESSVPVLEEHAGEVHREPVAAALAHWTVLAKQTEATRYEIPVSHIVKNALAGIAKDIGVVVPRSRRKR